MVERHETLATLEVGGHSLKGATQSRCADVFHGGYRRHHDDEWLAGSSNVRSADRKRREKQQRQCEEGE
jgi:hypothetical protein